MYQHLSKAAQVAIKFAEYLARRNQQEYVGTEHVLLALVREEKANAGRILNNLSVNSETIENTINDLIRDSMEETWVFGKLPGSPHFKQVINLAIKEAQDNGDKLIGTEHILAGLLLEENCLAQRVLAQLGVTLSAVRNEINNMRNQVAEVKS